MTVKTSPGATRCVTASSGLPFSAIDTLSRKRPLSAMRC